MVELDKSQRYSLLQLCTKLAPSSQRGSSWLAVPVSINPQYNFQQKFRKKKSPLGFRREKVTTPVVKQLGLHSGCCGIPKSHAQPSLSFSPSPKSDIVTTEVLVLTHCHQHCHEQALVGELGSALGRLHPNIGQLQWGGLQDEKS